MKRFSRAITRWGWLPPVLAAAAIVVGGAVGAMALTGDGDASSADKVIPDASLLRASASGGASTTTTTPPPAPDELCQTIANEGYTLEGNQALATLEGAGTQVRAGNAKAAAEAYLTALSADIMLVGDAELVYQAMGIHPSRILGSSSEDVDPAHELELIRADAEHRDEVCEQTVLEAQESLETGELVHVTLSEQASFNMLVHDEQNEMLPRWVCQVPLPEEGIDVLGFAQFVDLETGDTAEKVMWSLTQRAYVSFGACPEGGVAADGEFEAILVECEEGQELVDRVCVEVAVIPSSAPNSQAGAEPDDISDDTDEEGGGSQDDDGDETGNGDVPGGGPDDCTDGGPTCPGPGPGGGGEDDECDDCPGPGETPTTDCTSNCGGTSTTTTAPTTTVPRSTSTTTTTVPRTTTTTTVAPTTTTTVPRTTTTTTTTTIPVTTTTVPRTTTTTTTVAPTTTTTIPVDLCPNIPGAQGPGWSGWDEGWRIDPDGNCKAPDPGDGGL